MRWLQGMDTVEPVFRQLRQEYPDLQLVMIILPGKTPIYGNDHKNTPCYMVIMKKAFSCVKGVSVSVHFHQY